MVNRDFDCVILDEAVSVNTWTRQMWNRPVAYAWSNSNPTIDVLPPLHSTVYHAMDYDFDALFAAQRDTRDLRNTTFSLELFHVTDARRR